MPSQRFKGFGVFKGLEEAVGCRRVVSVLRVSKHWGRVAKAF